MMDIWESDKTIATWMKWMNKSILGSVSDCNIYRQIEKIIYE